MVFVKAFLFSEKDKVSILLIFTLFNEKRTLSQQSVLCQLFITSREGYSPKPSTLRLKTSFKKIN